MYLDCTVTAYIFKEEDIKVYIPYKIWCRHQESNSGPTDYKSSGLLFILIYKAFLLTAH